MKAGKSDTEADLNVGCAFGYCNTYLEVGFSCGSELDFTAPFGNTSIKN